MEFFSPDWSWEAFAWGCLGAFAPEGLRLYKLRVSRLDVASPTYYLIVNVGFVVLAGVITAGALNPSHAFAALYSGMIVPLLISILAGET
jgi:hypothetical protein